MRTVVLIWILIGRQFPQMENLPKNKSVLLNLDGGFLEEEFGKSVVLYREARIQGEKRTQHKGPIKDTENQNKLTAPPY